jgi:hypothetical protein
MLRNAGLRTRAFGIALLVMTAWGCGGGGGDSTPAPTPVTLTLSGPESPYFIGSNYTFTASVQGATWGNDAPSIVTINNGTMTGLASGNVTIWADARGQRATKLLRVMPNYGGSWSGSYTVASCVETGQIAAVHFCRDEFRPGRPLRAYANITQNNANVSATMSLGDTDLRAANGVISMGGDLHLAASKTEDGVTLNTTWDLTSKTAGQLKGSVNFTISSTEGTGYIQVIGHNIDAARDSASAQGLRGVQAHTLEDLVHLIARQ